MSDIAHDNPIIGDLSCLRCGYNLRGLRTGGACPECGIPIRNMLREDVIRRFGMPTLIRWRRGVLIVQIGTILQAVVAAAGIGIAIATTDRSGFPAEGTVHLAAALILGACPLSAWGWWLLSSPDPFTQAGARIDKHRRALRVALVLKTPAVPYLYIAWFAPESIERGAQSSVSLALLAMFIGLVSFVAWLAWFFLSTALLRWFGSLAPDPTLERKAQRMMSWQGPLLLTVGTLACGMGPVFAALLYLLLLERAGREFRGAQARAALEPQR